MPDLPEPTLAVALQEVLGGAALSKATLIPFAPPFVLGVSEWRGGVITVVGMATVLCCFPNVYVTYSTSDCGTSSYEIGAVGRPGNCVYKSITLRT